jgi:hypothetical protein
MADHVTDRQFEQYKAEVQRTVNKLVKYTQSLEKRIALLEIAARGPIRRGKAN